MVISKACKKAGVSEAGYHKAMLRPAVIAHFEAVQAQFIQTIERRRAGYKARAYEVAAELMERGKNEATRMRAVEFFAGEGKVGTQVNVALSVNPGGYEFVKPGQQVVEIVPSQDSASSEQSSQPIEDAEILPDVGE